MSSLVNKVRIGSVSYLNSKPLIYGLEKNLDLELTLEVPSQLLAGLRDERFDIALLPVIDYQRLEGLKLVPSAGIGSDGPALTVRIFSRKPIEQMRTLACDPDSHTSVALARIILAEKYGLYPELVSLAENIGDQDAAKLLIGDKVVCEPPTGMPHQLDLGEAWKSLTGMPFVFAIWTARAGVDLGDVPVRLEAAKRAGLANLEQIITHHATPFGWPPLLAMQYLTNNLKFDIGPAQLEAIRRFHQMVGRERIIPDPPRPLEIYGQS